MNNCAYKSKFETGLWLTGPYALGTLFAIYRFYKGSNLLVTMSYFS
jgi:hypothetical protein